MLIEHSLSEAKRLGFNAIILGGLHLSLSSIWICRYKEIQYISMPDGKYYTSVMALPLFEGALDGINGSVHFSEAMYPDESILDEFDKTFAERKEIFSTPARF